MMMMINCLINCTDPTACLKDSQSRANNTRGRVASVQRCVKQVAAAVRSLAEQLLFTHGEGMPMWGPGRDLAWLSGV